MAKPCEPNNVVIEQEKTTEKNTTTTKTVGPEVYLCEITAFYQQIITILFGVIGILLVLSFAYVYFTSKRQTEEMAREALKEQSFGIILNKKISDMFIESKNTGDISELFDELEEIQERIKYLEEQINIQSYGERGDENQSEAR
jgi:tRNA nucleotidyltransferase (CCA-adding enzyme)